MLQRFDPGKWPTIPVLQRVDPVKGPTIPVLQRFDSVKGTSHSCVSVKGVDLSKGPIHSSVTEI